MTPADQIIENLRREIRRSTKDALRHHKRLVPDLLRSVTPARIRAMAATFTIAAAGLTKCADHLEIALAQRDVLNGEIRA